jgi:hypothetical protein
VTWRRSLLLAAAGLALNPGLHAAELAPAPAAAVFGEAAAACERDGGALFNLPLCGPLLLVDASSRAVVGDRADSRGYLQPTPEGVWVGSLPTEVPAANTAVEWAGRRWSMLLWPLPADAAERTRLLAHEMFHRVQAELGLPAAGTDCGHLGGGEGRFWLLLELRALAGALHATDPAAARAATADALRFRARRHELFPAAAAAETALERHEGLAEYAGVALAWSEPAQRRQRVAARLEALPAEPSLVRSFAYTTGPAYGLLLDGAGVTWRRPRGAEADVAVLAAAALLPAAGEDASGDLDEVARAWGAAAVRAEEAARERASAERLAAFRARLVDGPVLQLPLAATSISFDPGAVFPLGELGTVYPTVVLSDRWGVLRVRAGGALLAADWTMATVPAPPSPDGPLAGEGWTLQLAAGWSAAAGTRPGDLRLQPQPGGRR